MPLGVPALRGSPGAVILRSIIRLLGEIADEDVVVVESRREIL